LWQQQLPLHMWLLCQPAIAGLLLGLALLQHVLYGLWACCGRGMSANL